MKLLLTFLSIILLIVCHEFGHYVLAEKRGNYNGWGLLPNPHIKLTHYFPHRLDYLSGFVASALPFPLWIFSEGLDMWLWYLLLMMGGASADFLVILGYGLLKKKEGGD
jgi:hypothetical protein